MSDDSFRPSGLSGGEVTFKVWDRQERRYYDDFPTYIAQDGTLWADLGGSFGLCELNSERYIIRIPRNHGD